MFVVVLVLLSLHCLCTLAKPDASPPETGYTSRRHRRRTEDRNYHPVPAPLLSEYEGRQKSSRFSDLDSDGLLAIEKTTSKPYDLRDSESFYWGRDGNPLANLTAYTDGETVKVLSMERFGDVLETAHCSNDSVQFKFTREVQFDLVHKQWAWLNDAEERYVVLVTENSRCSIPDGDPTTRQPWHVISAAFDYVQNLVTLDARPVRWQQAFSDWRLKVKSRGLLPGDSRKRSLSRPYNRRFVISGDPTIPLAHNFSGGELNLEVDNSGAVASIVCDPCYTTGSLDFDIDVVPWVMADPAHPFEGPHLDGYVSVIANGIGASFTAVSSANAPLTNGASGDVTLWSWSPPDMGISIKDILQLGLTLELDVAGNLGQTAAAFNLTSGVQITIPDNSVYKADFDDSSKNENRGWVPQFAAIAPSMSESLSVTGSIGTQLRLQFGGEIIGVSADVGVMLAAPTLELSTTAIAQPDACGVSGADYGVELEIDLGGSIDTYEGITAGLIHDAATQTIVGFSTELWSTCFTIPHAATSQASSVPSVNYSIGPSRSSITMASSATAAEISSPASPTD